MTEPDANRIEETLLAFVASRLDPTRVRALIAAAIEGYADQERVNAMLCRAADVLWRVLPDERVEVYLVYTEDSWTLALARAAAWNEQPREPPAVDSPERDDVLGLARLPASALATLPRG